jgi:hypothetical protein
MVHAAHADEPIDHPKHQGAGNQDNEAFQSPLKC